jgi:[ribosomal protein S18]-alanine N-acetyltransferase
MPQPVIVTANAADLPDLWRLECACFDATRRTNRRGLRRSLQSPRQRVRLLRLNAGEPAAAYATLFLHPHTLRIYSIAVAPEHQGRGLGKALVKDAIALAVRAGARTVSLEVDALDTALMAWYERQGFATVARLDDYYAAGRPAVRMRRPLDQPPADR